MQLRCVELTEFTPPPPKSLVEPHTRVLWVGAIRCLWGVRARVIAHTEIYILIGGSGIFTSPIRDDPSLSVHTFCVRVGRICRSDTDRERFSESRVETVAGLGTRLPVPQVIRSCITHAGVVTICTVPEMLPETWTRGNDVRQDGFVLLSCHFSQRLSIRTRTPPCPSPSPSSPPCASPPSRSRAATLPPG